MRQVWQTETGERVLSQVGFASTLGWRPGKRMQDVFAWQDSCPLQEEARRNSGEGSGDDKCPTRSNQGCRVRRVRRLRLCVLWRNRQTVSHDRPHEQRRCGIPSSDRWQANGGRISHVYLAAQTQLSGRASSALHELPTREAHEQRRLSASGKVERLSRQGSRGKCLENHRAHESSVVKGKDIVWSHDESVSSRKAESA